MRHVVMPLRNAWRALPADTSGGVDGGKHPADSDIAGPSRRQRVHWWVPDGGWGDNLLGGAFDSDATAVKNTVLSKWWSRVNQGPNKKYGILMSPAQGTFRVLADHDTTGNYDATLAGISIDARFLEDVVAHFDSILQPPHIPDNHKQLTRKHRYRDMAVFLNLRQTQVDRAENDLIQLYWWRDISDKRAAMKDTDETQMEYETLHTAHAALGYACKDVKKQDIMPAKCRPRTELIRRCSPETAKQLHTTVALLVNRYMCTGDVKFEIMVDTRMQELETEFVAFVVDTYAHHGGTTAASKVKENAIKHAESGMQRQLIDKLRTEFEDPSIANTGVPENGLVELLIKPFYNAVEMSPHDWQSIQFEPAKTKTTQNSHGMPITSPFGARILEVPNGISEKFSQIQVGRTIKSVSGVRVGAESTHTIRGRFTGSDSIRVVFQMDDPKENEVLEDMYKDIENIYTNEDFRLQKALPNAYVDPDEEEDKIIFSEWEVDVRNDAFNSIRVTTDDIRHISPRTSTISAQKAVRDTIYILDSRCLNEEQQSVFMMNGSCTTMTKDVEGLLPITIDDEDEEISTALMLNTIQDGLRKDPRLKTYVQQLIIGNTRHLGGISAYEINGHFRGDLMAHLDAFHRVRELDEERNNFPGSRPMSSSAKLPSVTVPSGNSRKRISLSVPKPLTWLDVWMWAFTEHGAKAIEQANLAAATTTGPTARYESLADNLGDYIMLRYNSTFDDPKTAEQKQTKFINTWDEICSKRSFWREPIAKTLRGAPKRELYVAVDHAFQFLSREPMRLVVEYVSSGKPLTELLGALNGSELAWLVVYARVGDQCITHMKAKQNALDEMQQYVVQKICPGEPMDLYNDSDPVTFSVLKASHNEWMLMHKIKTQTRYLAHTGDRMHVLALREYGHNKVNLLALHTVITGKACTADMLSLNEAELRQRLAIGENVYSVRDALKQTSNADLRLKVWKTVMRKYVDGADTSNAIEQATAAFGTPDGQQPGGEYRFGNFLLFAEVSCDEAKLRSASTFFRRCLQSNDTPKTTHEEMFAFSHQFLEVFHKNLNCTAGKELQNSRRKTMTAAEKQLQQLKDSLTYLGEFNKKLLQWCFQYVAGWKLPQPMQNWTGDDLDRMCSAGILHCNNRLSHICVLRSCHIDMGEPQDLDDGYVTPRHTSSIGIDAVSKMVLAANPGTPQEAVHDTLRAMCKAMSDVSESLAGVCTVYATARPGVDYSMWIHMSSGDVADVVQSVNEDNYYTPEAQGIFGQGVKTAHLRHNNDDIAGGWWDAPAKPNPMLHTLVSKSDSIQAHLRVDGGILVQQGGLTNDTSNLPDTILEDAESHCRVFSMLGGGPVLDVGTACGSLPTRALMLEQFMSTQRYNSIVIPDTDVTVTTAASSERGPYLLETCTEMPAGLENHALSFGETEYIVRRVNLEDRKHKMIDAIKRVTHGATKHIRRMRRKKACLENNKSGDDASGWDSDTTTIAVDGDDDGAMVAAGDGVCLSYSQAAKYVQDMGLLTIDMVALWEAHGCMPKYMPPYSDWPAVWMDDWAGFDNFVQFEEFEVCLPDGTLAVAIRRGALGTTAEITLKCETVIECANYVSIATWANQWVYPLHIAKRPSRAAVLVFTDTQLTDINVLTCCGFAPLHPKSCAYGAHTDIIGAMVVPGEVTPGERQVRAKCRSWAHSCISGMQKAAAGAEKNKKMTPHEYRSAGQRVNDLCDGNKMDEAASLYTDMMHCVISGESDPVNADYIAGYLYDDEVAEITQMFDKAVRKAAPSVDTIIDAANQQWERGEACLQLAENDFRALVQLWDGDGSLDKRILSVPFGQEECKRVADCFQRFRESIILDRCYTSMENEVAYGTLVQNVTTDTALTEQEVGITLDEYNNNLWQRNGDTWKLKDYDDEAFEKHDSELNTSDPGPVASRKTKRPGASGQAEHDAGRGAARPQAAGKRPRNSFIPLDSSSSEEENNADQPAADQPAADLTRAIGSFLDYLLQGTAEKTKLLRTDIRAATDRVTKLAVGTNVRTIELNNQKYNAKDGFINGGPYQDTNDKSKKRWSVALTDNGNECKLLPKNLKIVYKPGFSDAKPHASKGEYLVDTKKHDYKAYQNSTKTNISVYSIHVPDPRNHQYNKELACLRFTYEEFSRCFRQFKAIVREKQKRTPVPVMSSVNNTNRLG